jgi:hypothetical protein
VDRKEWHRHEVILTDDYFVDETRVVFGWSEHADRGLEAEGVTLRWQGANLVEIADQEGCRALARLLGAAADEWKRVKEGGQATQR